MSMVGWDTIGCTRGHDWHDRRSVGVRLNGPTGFSDLTPIPHRLARAFSMEVWDPGSYPVDGGPYCPAHDAVSETIVNLGVWEPVETVLTLAVLEGHRGEHMVDVGAQIGWFTLLAASCGCDVIAVEADPDCADLIEWNAKINGWDDRVTVRRERIGVDQGGPPVGDARLVKIDVEGAEAAAVDAMWPAIEAGRIEHLLVEVSPVFGPGYGDLVAAIIAAGYDAYTLPDKATPPIVVDNPATALNPGRLPGGDRGSPTAAAAIVETWHQKNVWFKHRDAAW